MNTVARSYRELETAGLIETRGRNGTFVAGSSHVNLVFDDFAFSKVKSYGAAHLVQNKWREFVPGG